MSMDFRNRSLFLRRAYIGTSKFMWLLRKFLLYLTKIWYLRVTPENMFIIFEPIRWNTKIDLPVYVTLFNFTWKCY